MKLDRYLERDSPLHRADARFKFLLTVGLILTLSLLPTGGFIAIGALWLVVVAASLTARISPMRVIRASFVATPFLLAAFPLIFTKTGSPLFDIPLGLFTLTASGEGLLRFLSIALKSWVSVQAAVLLTFTTHFPDLVEGLRRLRLPTIIVGVISFMYRYLAVLTDEAERMLRARASRSASSDGKAGGSIRWRAKVVGSMVGSLFLRAYERSERVYAAMLARGFDGEIRRLHGRSLARGEWAGLATSGVALIAVEVAAHQWLPGVA